MCADPGSRLPGQATAATWLKLSELKSCLANSTIELHERQAQHGLGLDEFESVISESPPKDFKLGSDMPVVAATFKLALAPVPPGCGSFKQRFFPLLPFNPPDNYKRLCCGQP